MNTISKKMNKLTILVEEDVYRGLYSRVGKGKISRYINDKIKPFVVEDNLLEAGYKALAKDLSQQKESNEWLEEVADIGEANEW